MEIRRGATGVIQCAEDERMARNTETAGLLELLHRVEGEYREMPGLSLTVSQAERLWGLDRRTCAVVLATLIKRQVLRQTPTGAYRLV